MTVDKGRVLITGGDGFTGYYVARELVLRGWEVWKAGLRPTNIERQYVYLDLLKKKSFSAINNIVRPNAVVHLAAASFVDYKDPDIYYRTNLIGTKLLLDTLLKCSVRPQHTILASSAAVYGNNGPEALSEGSTLCPANDYGVSKLATEFLAHTYSDELVITITRPFNYTGVGQSDKFLVPKIVKHFLEKSPRIPLGNLEVSRDFSDVRDIAKYYADILEAAPHRKVINLCSGRCYRLTEVLNICRELSGQNPKIATEPTLMRASDITTLRGDRHVLNGLAAKSEIIPLEKTLAWMLSKET